MILRFICCIKFLKILTRFWFYFVGTRHKCCSPQTQQWCLTSPCSRLNLNSSVKMISWWTSSCGIQQSLVYSSWSFLWCTTLGSLRSSLKTQLFQDRVLSFVVFPSLFVWNRSTNMVAFAFGNPFKIKNQDFLYQHSRFQSSHGEWINREYHDRKSMRKVWEKCVFSSNEKFI